MSKPKKRIREKKSLSKIPFYPGIWIHGVEKILREHIKDKRRYRSPDDKEADISAGLRHLAILDWPRIFPRRPKAFTTKLKTLLGNETLIKHLAEMNSNQERALELVGRLYSISPGRLRHWMLEEWKAKAKRPLHDIIHGRPALFSTASFDSPELKQPVRYQEIKLS